MRRRRDHRQLAGRTDHGFGDRFAAVLEIDRPACKARAALCGRHVEAGCPLYEWKDVHVCEALVELDAAGGVLERVHDVKTEGALGTAEPAHVRDIAVARHHADPAIAVYLVHPVIAAGPDTLGVARRRVDGKQRVMLRDDEVVHQRAVRRVKPLLALKLAVPVRDAVRDLRRRGRRLHSQEEHRWCRIDAHDAPSCPDTETAVEVSARAFRASAGRHDTDGRPPSSSADARMPYRCRVRDRPVHASDLRLVRERVAVLARTAHAPPQPRPRDAWSARSGSRNSPCRP